MRGSNPRPGTYKVPALPTELTRRLEWLEPGEGLEPPRVSRMLTMHVPSPLGQPGINAWCGIKDSNLSLSPCKGDTLPNELIPLSESGAEWLIRTTNILYVKEMLYR